MSEASVLVVVPTYMEASNIENLLRNVRSSEPRANILVVDDNSSDGTPDVVERCASELGQIELLRRPGKAGLGSAYKAGFARGMERGFAVLVEMDADMSHDPANLPQLLKLMDEGADLVIGSRYVAGGSIPGWSLHRALLSRFGNQYARLLLSLDVNDATSGYRCYRSNVLRRVDLDAVRADGYGFQIEMAYRMRRAGAAVVETPITFVDRVEGESKMSGRIILEALWLVTVWGLRDRLHRLRSSSRHHGDEAEGSQENASGRA